MQRGLRVAFSALPRFDRSGDDRGDGENVAENGGDGSREDSVKKPQGNGGKIERTDVLGARAPKADQREEGAEHGENAIPILPTEECCENGERAKGDGNIDSGCPRTVLLRKDDVAGGVQRVDGTADNLAEQKEVDCPKQVGCNFGSDHPSAVV